MTQYCFGIDVGGTSIKCGLFQTDGQLIDKWEIKTRVADGGKNILPDIANTVFMKVKERAIDEVQVSGIGIGVPGPVNDMGEIPCAVNLNWGKKNIEHELKDLSGFPVKAGNDANVAALGEMWKGGGAGTKNMILVTLGTGVGGGIIINEKMVAGTHGAGGEIGHAHVNFDEAEYCNCGNQGCLEQYASATGIARLARKMMQEYKEDSLLRTLENVNAKNVFDAYKQQDNLAIHIVEKFAKYLGSAIGAFACVVDPEVIVIGGGVSKAGDVLVDVVSGYYRKYAFTTCKDTPIVLAKLGNDAGIYGAAKLVLSV